MSCAYFFQWYMSLHTMVIDISECYAPHIICMLRNRGYRKTVSSRKINSLSFNALHYPYPKIVGSWKKFRIFHFCHCSVMKKKNSVASIFQYYVNRMQIEIVERKTGWQDETFCRVQHFRKSPQHKSHFLCEARRLKFVFNHGLDLLQLWKATIKHC